MPILDSSWASKAPESRMHRLLSNQKLCKELPKEFRRDEQWDLSLVHSATINTVNACMSFPDDAVYIELELVSGFSLPRSVNRHF